MSNRLSKWLAHSTSETLHGRIIDIHIDEIDPSLEPSEQWVGGIQRLLVEGARLLAAGHDGRFVLAGAFALRSLSHAIGVNFSDEATLQHEFDMTPPSLYVFMRGNEPWARQDFVHLSSALHFSIITQAAIMYLEYKEPNEVEFRRSLWIVPSYDSGDVVRRDNARTE